LPADVADATRRPSFATGSVAGAVSSFPVLGPAIAPVIGGGQPAPASFPALSPGRLRRDPTGGLEGKRSG